MTLARALEPDERPRILVVDDEADISATVAFCLEQEGFDVKTAGNGYEALGVVRAWLPHLVLLDVMMPGENGYRVCRLVNRQQSFRFETNIIGIAANLNQRPDAPPD